MYKKITKHAGGRPTVMTKETLDKLKTAYDYGCTDEEACLHAEIDVSTLCKYQKKHPQFVADKEARKKRPVLKARSNIVKRIIKGDISLSQWYLTKKLRREFGDKVDIGFEDTPSIAFNITVRKPDGTIEQPQSRRIIDGEAE